MTFENYKKTIIMGLNKTYKNILILKHSSANTLKIEFELIRIMYSSIINTAIYNI